VNFAGIPSWLNTSSAAPVVDRLRTMQSIASPPNSIVAAFETRWRNAIRVSTISSKYAEGLKTLIKNRSVVPRESSNDHDRDRDILSANALVEIDHCAPIQTRVPQCVSLRDGLNTRSTCRFSARIAADALMTLARLLFATVCLCASSAFADNLSGQASIIDGDTLEIHGTRIRLWGIDAPESNQLCRGEDSIQYRCGAKAANDLDTFLAKRPIDCAPVSLDQYRGTVATCSVDGVDLADWLVRNGLALDWPQYSKGKYDEAQRDAEHAGRGIWVGSYVEPWLFRACIRQGGRPGDCSDDANSHP
jgi:endonuclease YncB( thermonuclease family)